MNMLYTYDLKQALNHELVLKKVYRVIKFNQNHWLNLYIDMNTDLRKKAKTPVFGKTMENVIKHIKLIATQRKRNYLVSKPNFHTAKFFTENLLVIEMKKTEILVNKSIYLGASNAKIK